MLKDRLIHAKNSLPPCTPPLWARSGHGQTILAHLLPSAMVKVPTREFDITLEKDSERIRSTYIKGTSSTVVYLFHGLAGSSEGTYMHRTALQAMKLGHHVFMNNHRGCGSGVGLASEPYHSGRAEDLSKVIAYGREMLPGHKHIAIGFSLSANALLLLAAKVRADVQPDFAIAVNGPINLESASLLLRTGLNKIYDDRFTKELKDYIRINRPQDAKGLNAVRNLREFDELYTARLGGFKSRDDYFASCSAKQYLKRINIPTVIITAHDDPFVSINDYLDAEYSNECFTHFEKHGGHMGFLMKNGLGYERWLDIALLKYLQSF